MNWPLPRRTLIRLVRAAQAGSTKARDRLLRALRPWLLNYAARFCPRHLCEDVVQEVQVAMVEKLYQLRNPAAFPAWLRQITRRMAQRVRARWRREAVSSLEDASWPAGGSAPGEPLERNERRQLVRQAINNLEEPFRQVMYDFYLEEMSVREISRRRGCPEGTVKRRLHTGREKLRKNLEPKLAL